VVMDVSGELAALVWKAAGFPEMSVTTCKTTQS
jgi:hypothetical protein